MRALSIDVRFTGGAARRRTQCRMCAWGHRNVHEAVKRTGRQTVICGDVDLCRVPPAAGSNVEGRAGSRKSTAIVLAARWGHKTILTERRGAGASLAARDAYGRRHRGRNAPAANVAKGGRPQLTVCTTIHTPIHVPHDIVIAVPSGAGGGGGGGVT